MIATALGEGDKKRDDQPATGRRRRKQRPDHQSAELADAEAQAAENAKKGVANDPAQEAPFLVRAVISTFDFGRAAPAAGAEAEADTEDKEEEE